MSTEPMARIVRGLRSAAGGTREAERTDCELLGQFVDRRDPAAFETLVRRHGPMVLGVCRRILGNAADAEDAFQATFLVLLRKASVILPRWKVAPWLYGVARRTALKAQAMSRHRREKEREAGRTAPAPARDDAGAALLDSLDLELARLPERYRTPIILCDLEGLSYREAASRVGCAVGTLSGRLTRGRALLARRLGCPAAVLSSLAVPWRAHGAQASLPAQLGDGVRRIAQAWAEANGVSQAAVAPHVLFLAEGTIKMMLLSKLGKLSVSAGFVVAAVVAFWPGPVRSLAGAPKGGSVSTREVDRPAPPTRGPTSATSLVDTHDAIFEVRGLDIDKERLSVVVAGTRGPVLSLPFKAGLEVRAGDRRAGIDALKTGTRLALQLDPTNSQVVSVRLVTTSRSSAIIRAPNECASASPPNEQEVLRALPRLPQGVPGVFQTSRNNIHIVYERLVDRVDSPRVIPLVGEAQVLHCQWKCWVNWDEVDDATFPLPFRAQRRRSEVVYIDKNYLVPVR